MKNIYEGVRFGERQVNDILSRSSDFNIGMEYELRMSDEQRSVLDERLSNIGLYDDVDTIVPEHDNMTEVITKKMPLSRALKHIRGMFDFIVDNDIEVPEMAGMHISISTNKYLLDSFNVLKYYLLMDTESIHRIFPERGHVHNSYGKILEIMEMHVYYSESYNLEHVKRSISKGKTSTLEDIIKTRIPVKYQTINVSDYHARNGRIELRFFGGQDYHSLYSDIKKQLLRALLLLELAYTDLYRQEYLKRLSKLVQDTENKVKRTTPKKDIDNSRVLFFKALADTDTDKILKILRYQDIGVSPQKLPPKLTEKLKSVLDKDAESAFMFAQITGKRFPEAEDTIASDAAAAFSYATQVLEERFPDGEETIIKDGYYAAMYIKKFFRFQRMPMTLERVLSSSDYPTLWYKYLQDLNNNKVLSKVDLEDIPEMSLDNTVKLVTRIPTLEIIKLIELQIINENNIEDILSTLVLNPSDSIKMVCNVMIRSYMSVNNIQVLDISSDTRMQLIKREYELGELMGGLSTDEKIATLDGLIEFLVDLSGKTEEYISNNIAKAITNDGMELVKVLKPYGKDFINKFEELTGVRLPDDSGVQSD